VKINTQEEYNNEIIKHFFDELPTVRL